MGEKFTRYDDLDLEESPLVVKHKFIIDDGEPFELDLKPGNFDAVEALLVKRNPELLRKVFAPNSALRRSRAEIMAIRDAARAARNPDGSLMFPDLKDNGRIPYAVDAWYATEYLPAQEAAKAAEGNTEGEAEVPEIVPARRRR